jgi:hypothetical protein
MKERVNKVYSLVPKLSHELAEDFNFNFLSVVLGFEKFILLRSYARLRISRIRREPGSSHHVERRHLRLAQKFDVQLRRSPGEPDRAVQLQRVA